MIGRFGGTPEQLLRRAGWLVRLRWGVIVLIGLGTLAARYAFGIQPPAREIFCLAGFLTLYNVATFVAVRWTGRLYQQAGWVGRASLLPSVEIIVDLIALSYLVHLTGGIESPLIVCFVFHMVIASILLPGKSAYSMCALVVVLLAGMVSIEYLVPSLHRHLPGFYPEELAQNAVFAFGTLGVISGALMFTVYLAKSIVAEVWERDRALLEADRLLRAKTEELALANEKLRKMEERKSRFLRAAAHQLKSPLSATVSTLNVILGGFVKGSPEKQLEMMERVRARIERMIDLVNDLALLARSRESDSEALRKGSVALDSVVKGVVDMLRARADEKGLNLEVHVAPVDCTVLGDESSLRDVVVNLLSNSIKYTPKGSVTVRLDKRGAGIECVVEDTGLGIPPEDLPHLCEDFYRASNVRTQFEGTGLGLSIVKEIVERHGGGIQIWSQLGMGTRVVVILPAFEESCPVEEEVSQL